MTSETPDRTDEANRISAKDFHGRVARGSAWIIAGRWAVRFIGICSTVILARLLAPEDFGVVAIALLVVGLAETVGKQGQRLAIIANQNADRDFVDSAWTASILVGIVSGLVVLALGSAIASYFDEPRAELVVYVMSLRIFLMGFGNIGMVFYVKNFDFATDFKFNIYEKVFPVGLTLAFAFVLRDYWALVFGNIFGHLLVIFTSYVMHPYRPRVCFTRIREVWAFSGWVLVDTLAAFINMRADRFFIPGVGNTQDLGVYQVGAELARMPTFELFMPLRRALFPAYARLTHAPREMANTFINVLSVAGLICLPVSVGFTLIADEAVRFIYGEKWAGAVPIVYWMSLNAGVLAITSTVYPVIQAMGKPRIAAQITVVQAVLLVSTLLFASGEMDALSQIAAVRTFTTLAVVPVAVICLRHVLAVPLREMVGAMWRPTLATAAMAAVLLYGVTPDLDLPLGLIVLVRIAAGAAIFSAILGLAWLLAGRPPGAEQALVRLIHSRLNRSQTPEA